MFVFLKNLYELLDVNHGKGRYYEEGSRMIESLLNTPELSLVLLGNEVSVAVDCVDETLKIKLTGDSPEGVGAYSASEHQIVLNLGEQYGDRRDKYVQQLSVDFAALGRSIQSDTQKRMNTFNLPVKFAGIDNQSEGMLRLCLKAGIDQADTVSEQLNYVLLAGGYAPKHHRRITEKKHYIYEFILDVNEMLETGHWDVAYEADEAEQRVFNDYVKEQLIAHKDALITEVGKCCGFLHTMALMETVEMMGDGEDVLVDEDSDEFIN